MGERTFPDADCLSSPIARFLGQASQLVEDGAFTDVGVTRQCNSQLLVMPV